MSNVIDKMEHGIIPHPVGGGLTPVAQPLDSAPNCIVHKTVRDENTLRMLTQPLELLQDLRSGYEDIECARELERAVDEVEVPGANQSVEFAEGEGRAPAATDLDEIEEVAQPKKRVRYSKEQLAVLQREYDLGASRRSNREIAVEIDMMPEGDGRKVVQDDVKNWMSAKARKVRSLSLVSSAGPA